MIVCNIIRVLIRGGRTMCSSVAHWRGYREQVPVGVGRNERRPLHESDDNRARDKTHFRTKATVRPPCAAPILLLMFKCKNKHMVLRAGYCTRNRVGATDHLEATSGKNVTPQPRQDQRRRRNGDIHGKGQSYPNFP